MPEIAEMKPSSGGLEVADFRKNYDCGVAVAEQHSFKSCGIAIAEVLSSGCRIAIADSKKSCACLGFPFYVKKLFTRNIVTDVTDGYYVVITVVTT